MNLLIVEDDVSMLTVLARTFEHRGFVVDRCMDGRAALERMRARQADAVILDLTLPELDGMQVLHAARAQGVTTPVLILTARGAVGDRVQGLDAGADDYLAKPFELDELEARVRALLRRASGPAGEEELACGALRLERTSGAFYVDDAPMEVTPREHALLKALIQRRGHALPKERLFQLVFPGESHVQLDAIEVVVYRLRKKLVGTGATLVTLRGLGYLLRCPCDR